MIVEDLMPFTADRLIDDVPILDEEDMKRYGFHSDVSLSERYRQNYDAILEAMPPLNEVAASTVMSPEMKEFIERRD